MSDYSKIQELIGAVHASSRTETIPDFGVVTEPSIEWQKKLLSTLVDPFKSIHATPAVLLDMVKKATGKTDMDYASYIRVLAAIRRLIVDEKSCGIKSVIKKKVKPTTEAVIKISDEITARIALPTIAELDEVNKLVESKFSRFTDRERRDMGVITSTIMDIEVAKYIKSVTVNGVEHSDLPLESRVEMVTVAPTTFVSKISEASKNCLDSVSDAYLTVKTADGATKKLYPDHRVFTTQETDLA